MIREFHLSPRGAGGISCDEAGAFVGAIPIVARARRKGEDEWRPRDCERLSRAISAQYGVPVDMASKRGGLMAIARAFNEGDLVRAMIATVHLGIPDPPPLSEGGRSRDRMSKLVRDLRWSGILKWDADAHPRWPAGSVEGRGGEFAPKDEGGGSGASDHRSFDSPKLILTAAEREDARDPRSGIGGNRPPEELIPQRLQQSPAGPVVQVLDNLLGITESGDEANLAAATLQMRVLLRAIREVDPNYIYESLDPPGGLAGMSWQGRTNVIRGLQADLAATIYRVRGDIRPLQEVTLDFVQRATNAAYDKAVQRYDAGELKVRLSREEAIGNDVDNAVRRELRYFFYGLRIPTGPGSAIRVNRRAYDTSDSPPSYRVPDSRVGDFAFDVSLEAKKPSKDQIRDFFNADFKPIGVVIVRPNQLGSNSSYIIWRTDGE